VAIAIIVLLAFVITSFGCRTMKKEKRLPDGEQTANSPEWLTPFGLLGVLGTTSSIGFYVTGLSCGGL